MKITNFGFIILCVSRLNFLEVNGNPIRSGKESPIDNPKIAIPCKVLKELKELNVDVNLSCIENNHQLPEPCEDIAKELINGTSEVKNCMQNFSLPPFCHQIAAYNLSLDCQKDQESENEEPTEDVSKVKIEVEAFPRNILDMKKSDETNDNLPDCVRITDDLSGKVTACETVRNYPEELMKELVMKKNLSKILTKEKSKTEPDLDDGAVIYNPVCRASSKILQLQAVHLPSRGWKYIVNIDNFVQALTIDKCSKEYEACAEIDRFLGYAFVSRCVQKNAVRNLFTLNSNSNDLELERFEFPAACVCQVGRKYG